jgi:tetratricopeptide (TPR) repeat protein
MAGNTKSAYPLLKTSIRILEIYDSNIVVYSLNIAAAFNYMGEAKRKEKNFEEAIKFYHTAISTCENNNCIVNPTFYTNMALCYYETKDFEKAYELFITAISLYDSSTVLMKRSIAISYAAEYYCKNGNFATAAKYFNEAEHFSKLLGSPSEKKIYSENYNKLTSMYGEKITSLI